MVQHRAEDRYRPRNADRRIVLISRDSTRSLTVRPWVAALAGVMAATLSVAYLGATAYLIFRDDIITGLAARNADMQQAYEGRIASLRSEIDRIASRQILDQVAFEDKVDRLIAAHRALGDRSEVINSLIDKARASGILADAPAGADQRADAATGYAPDGNADIERRFAALTDVGNPDSGPDRFDGIPLDREGRPDVRALTVGLAEIDRAQTEAVHSIAAAAEERVEAVQGIVADLGITLKLPAPDVEKADASALGGPYVPLASSEALASALADADEAFGTLGSLKRAVARLPLASPVDDAPMSSNFGSRRDPFLGSAAFHAGIDFRAPSGRGVEATAAGRVVVAGRSGGYGNLVEIDHGKGLTTRYAHLSKIEVRVGQQVEKGDMVGRVGSTGRSTGPHLHYETRVNGTAVNPKRYLAAGARIETMLP